MFSLYKSMTMINSVLCFIEDCFMSNLLNFFLIDFVHKFPNPITFGSVVSRKSTTSC